MVQEWEQPRRVAASQPGWQWRGCSCQRDRPVDWRDAFRWAELVLHCDRFNCRYSRPQPCWRGANESQTLTPSGVYLFMEALVLERKGELSIREIALPTEVAVLKPKLNEPGPRDCQKKSFRLWRVLKR